MIMAISKSDLFRFDWVKLLRRKSSSYLREKPNKKSKLMKNNDNDYKGHQNSNCLSKVHNFRLTLRNK